MYKIVDEFNGREDSARYTCLKHAERALEKAWDAFRAEPRNTGARCTLAVRHADSEWAWDYALNRFCWR